MLEEKVNADGFDSSYSTVTVDEWDAPKTETKPKRKVTKKEVVDNEYALLHSNGKFEYVDKIDGAYKKLKDDSARFVRVTEMEAELSVKEK